MSLRRCLPSSAQRPADRIGSSVKHADIQRELKRLNAERAPTCGTRSTQRRTFVPAGSIGFGDLSRRAGCHWPSDGEFRARVTRVRYSRPRPCGWSGARPDGLAQFRWNLHARDRARGSNIICCLMLILTSVYTISAAKDRISVVMPLSLEVSDQISKRWRAITFPRKR